MGFEAVVVLGPEHVRTIHRDGFSKQNVRDFLFENTGVPLRCYDGGEPGEGVQQRGMYKEITHRWRAVLPEVPRAGGDQDRRRGRNGREVFRGAWKLVHWPAREPNGDVSDWKVHMPIRMVNPLNETAPHAAQAAPRLDDAGRQDHRAAGYLEAWRQHLSRPHRAIV